MMPNVLSKPFNWQRYIDDLDSNVELIELHNLELRELPDLSRFQNLKKLFIQYNHLTSLPKLPDTLEVLFCNGNQLTSLENLPEGLLDLYCAQNLLTELPPLPPNLKSLSCRKNLLSFLPPLPNGLRQLYCGDNHLLSLPPLPNSLETLHCENCDLRNLPPLPKKCFIMLYCQGNKNLTELRDLPSTLIEINCSNCSIQYISSLPENLLNFICYMNKLFCFPIIPENTNICELNFNPGYFIISKSFNPNNPRFQNLADSSEKKKHIYILYRFRYLYYSLKYQKVFREFLWEKIRKPKIERRFHPRYLLENLDEEKDLDEVLNKW